MKVGLLGAGRIATAFAEGWTRPALDVSRRPALWLFDVVVDRARELAGRTGGRVADSPGELVRTVDIVMMAVEPSAVPGVLDAIAADLGETPLVSLAAFVRLERLRAPLSPTARVGRVMPNVAAAQGRAVLLFVSGTLGDAQADVRAVIEPLGTVVPIMEDVFDLHTAVSGCGPGFMAYFAEALERAAVAAGVPADTARLLVAESAAGIGLVIGARGDAGAVRETIVTPGGMTGAGIGVLADGGLEVLVAEAVSAAAARAKEQA
jgi:pyrroline-5-carboxylate reductase